MASKAGARIKITLRCSECKQRNYNTMKNKKNTPDRSDPTGTAERKEG